MSRKELNRQKCYDALAMARTIEKTAPDQYRSEAIQLSRDILNNDLMRVAYTGHYNGGI